MTSEGFYEICPVSSPIVNDIFDMCLDGKTMKEITNYLNEKKIKSNTGKDFNVSAVQRILKNRKYIGEYSYNDVFIPNGISQIIPEEKFDKIQEKLQDDKYVNKLIDSLYEFQKHENTMVAILKQQIKENDNVMFCTVTLLSYIVRSNIIYYKIKNKIVVWTRTSEYCILIVYRVYRIVLIKINDLDSTKSNLHKKRGIKYGF